MEGGREGEGDGRMERQTDRQKDRQLSHPQGLYITHDCDSLYTLSLPLCVQFRSVRRHPLRQPVHQPVHLRARQHRGLQRRRRHLHVQRLLDGRQLHGGRGRVRYLPCRLPGEPTGGVPELRRRLRLRLRVGLRSTRPWRQLHRSVGRWRDVVRWWWWWWI